MLLVLPLYLKLFLMWLHFRHVIKMMADVESRLNDDKILLIHQEMVLSNIGNENVYKCNKQRQSTRRQKAMDIRKS